MEDATTPVLSGMAVLVAGALAFIIVTSGDSVVSAEQTPPVAGAPSYSELDPEVERVLLTAGAAWVYQGAVPAGIPDVVGRVLDAYQVPLMIPEEESR